MSDFDDAAIPPAPLDLRAVEALRCDRTGHPPGTDTMMVGTCCPCASCRAYYALVEPLLAHCRALRAALQPFAGMYEPRDRDVERMADTCPVQWQYAMYGTQGLTLGDLKRAAAVLGAARDGPA